MIKVVKPEDRRAHLRRRVSARRASCARPSTTCSAKPDLTTEDLKTLQERTFYGKEKKSLAYVIAIMNMILHGIEAPNIIHTNTLAENLADIQEKDRFDVVLANPPFGGKERKEVQQNFPIRPARRRSCSSSTSSRCSRPAGAAASSSRTPSSPTPTTPR